MKRLIPLLAVTCLAAVVLSLCLALPTFPLTTYRSWRREYCRKCGIRSDLQESGLGGWEFAKRQRRSLEATPLSQWYAAHLDKTCTHDWRFNPGEISHNLELFGIVLRSGPTESACRPRPSFVELNARDRARLEDLVQRSPDACRDYITKRLTGWFRRGAMMHTLKMRAALASRPEYARIDFSVQPIDGVGGIFIWGSVASREQQERLKAILDATAPPVDVRYEVVVDDDDGKEEDKQEGGEAEME